MIIILTTVTILITLRITVTLMSRMTNWSLTTSAHTRVTTRHVRHVMLINIVCYRVGGTGGVQITGGRNH